MQFKSEFVIPFSQYPVRKGDQFFLAGSCFAEHLFKGLKNWRFPARGLSNGILFNPLSIANAFRDLLEQNPIEADDLIEEDGIFLSRFHHGAVYDTQKERLLERTKCLQQEDLAFLKSAKFLIVSFGTAKAWKHVHRNYIVANCHKEAASNFSSYRLSVADIVAAWKSVLDKLFSINPGIQVVFTVSPVKYLKEGFHENNLSKSTLLLATEQLCASYPSCNYFPSYEIVLDELRDYRFFETDFAHPTQQAINYVLHKFRESWFEPETREMIQQLEQLQKRESHRFLHPEAHSAVKFIEDTQKMRRELELKYPFQDWTY